MYLQHCLVVAWLVPCETAAISAHSVYMCIITHHFMQSHICRVHACLPISITCHLHFWQNGHDSFMCYCGNRGGMDTEIKAQKVDHGEENSPASSMCESCENITMIAASLSLTVCDVMKSGVCSRHVHYIINCFCCSSLIRSNQPRFYPVKLKFNTHTHTHTHSHTHTHTQSTSVTLLLIQQQQQQKAWKN